MRFPNQPAVHILLVLAAILSLAHSTPFRAQGPAPIAYDVKNFGAKGDGKELDTTAITRQAFRNR